MWVSVTFILVFAIWVLWSYQSFKRKNRLLRALPRTPIRDVVAGTKVRIVGTARSLGQDVGAHFSQTVCLACHSWIRDGSASSTPQPEDRVVAFQVEDETGAIDIRIENIQLSLHGGSVDMTSNHGFGASILARDGEGMTYYEDTLPLNSRVAVIGYVVRADDGTTRLAGRPREPLVITNMSDAFIE